MAYMTGIGNCFGCGKRFSFNVNKVPSIPIRGERQPICEDCVNLVNPRREARGLDPIKILPGAYEPEEVA